MTPSASTGPGAPVDPHVDPDADPTAGRGVRRRSRERRSSPVERRAAVAIAVMAGLVAATAPVSPTGLAWFDHLLAGVLGALVALAASQSTPATWLWLSGVATALSLGSIWVVPAAASLALTTVLLSRGELRTGRRWLGAAVGALAITSLLRSPALGFFGLPSVVTLAAVTPVLWSAWRRSPPTMRHRSAIAAGAVAVVVVIATLGLAISGLMARQQVNAAIDHARGGLDALRSGDQESAGALFEQATREFDEAHDAVSAPWAQPARLVPVLAQQADAVRTVTAAGRSLTGSAAVAATTAPYRQLRADAGRIDLDVLRSMHEPVQASAAALDEADDDVASVRSPWLVAPLDERIGELADEIARTRPEAEVAAQALDVAPGLLGGDGVRRYFVAFATPAESRFQGGFVGAYGILTADGGRVSLERSGPIAELSDAPGADERTIDGLPVYEERYGRFQPARFLQNLTASPDLPDNAAALAQVLPQAGGPAIDGVIYVDPVGLDALLQLTGPVTVDGFDQPLEAGAAAEFLLRGQYLGGGTDQAREDALTRASRGTFDALVGRELPSPAEIGADLGPAVRGGHLLFTAFDDAEDAFLRRLGTTGAFLGDVEGAGPGVPDGHGSDWFSLRTADGSGNKIDGFLRREVAYDAAFDPVSGALDATATITLHNDAPASGLPDYVIGNLHGLPTGTNRLYLGFFTADELTSATLDGEPLAIETQREFSGQVYSSLVEVAPGATSTVVLHLRGLLLPAPGAPAGPLAYRLAVGHQPLVTDDHVSLRVRTTEPGDPDADDWVISGAWLRSAGDGATPLPVDGSTVSVDLDPTASIALGVTYR